jgi:glycosyltransferase involved in cell wall biosynthesis
MRTAGRGISRADSGHPSTVETSQDTCGQNPSDMALGPFKLLHAFPTFAVGGAQTRFAGLANALGHGFEHVVVSGDGNRDSAQLVGRHVQLRLRPLVSRKGSGLSLTNLRTFRSVLRGERPDLLLTYNWGAIEWALADRIRPICPHLHVVDGFGPEEALAQLPRRVWLRRLALSGATTVVVPSQTLRAVVTEVWRLDPGRVHHIPNGVDGAALARQARQPFGLRRHADERLFGTLAGLRPEKSLDRLLRIAALLPDAISWRLVIAGEGAQRAALEALIRELGLAERVAFTGFVDRPGSVLGELDVYVLTSDTEQMPIAVLEAMALGLPVLATDVGDLRLMLPPTSRDACLFGRGEEPAFAARLAALLTAPDERRRLGALNRERAAEFSLQAMVARYERLLRDLIAAG